MIPPRLGLAAILSLFLALPGPALAQSWGLRGRLTAPSPVEHAFFATEIAFDGDRLIVNQLQHPSSVHRFARLGTGFVHVATYFPPGSDERFYRLAMDGDVLVVSVSQATVGAASKAGIIHIYDLGAVGGAPVATLALPDPRPEEELGTAVAVSGDRVAALACDGPIARVGVFERGATGWAWVTTIEVADASSFSTCTAQDRPLTFQGDRLMLGLPFHVASGGERGAVAVFDAAVGWAETDRIIARDFNGAFGSSVEAQGDRAVVTEPYSPYGIVGNGSVRVVEPATPDWSRDILEPTGPAGNFGHSVALFGDRLAVTAPRNVTPGSPFPGDDLYVYQQTSAGWMLEAALAVDRSEWVRGLGHAVDAAGDVIVVGAWADDVGTTGAAGSVYVFAHGEARGSVCAADDECISGFCVDGVCCESACGDGADDCMVCSAAAGAPEDGLCAPRLAAEGYVCRAAVDACDVPERCDGEALECPSDVRSAEPCAAFDGGPMIRGDSGSRDGGVAPVDAGAPRFDASFEPLDGSMEAPAPAGGCGCATASPSDESPVMVAALLLLLGTLGLRRAHRPSVTPRSVNHRRARKWPVP